MLSLAALPFGNLSDYRGRLLDRRAAAAVSAEAPALWEPLAPAEVLRALEDLNVPWPLDAADVQKLCARVGAAGAVTGVVKQVQVQNQGAQVTLVMEILEPLSGEVVGRAQGLGKFSTREALPVDSRVDQALQRAARAAWAALGPPPAVVGSAGIAATGNRLSLKLAEEARLSPQAVLLLFPPAEAPAGPPVAAVVVESVAGGLAQTRVIGRRTEIPVGAVALAIGRLP